MKVSWIQSIRIGLGYAERLIGKYMCVCVHLSRLVALIYAIMLAAANTLQKERRTDNIEIARWLRHSAFILTSLCIQVYHSLLMLEFD